MLQRLLIDAQPGVIAHSTDEIAIDSILGVRLQVVGRRGFQRFGRHGVFHHLENDEVARAADDRALELRSAVERGLRDDIVDAAIIRAEAREGRRQLREEVQRQRHQPASSPP